jgi:hypothetical protein
VGQRRRVQLSPSPIANQPHSHRIAWRPVSSAERVGVRWDPGA